MTRVKVSAIQLSQIHVEVLAKEGYHEAIER